VADEAKLSGIALRFETRRRALVAAERTREAALPERFWTQTSHFTTPATDLETIRKAARGLSGGARLLERLAIAPKDLAAELALDEGFVRSVLATPGGPPLLMIDGEDALATGAEAVVAGRRNAIEAFATIEWGSTLAFYRPRGLELDGSVEDLVTVISGTAARARGKDLSPRGASGAGPSGPSVPWRPFASRKFPIDGIVWPKARGASELVFLDDLLGELERTCELERGTVRVAFLVEAGRAVAGLGALVEAILPRLSAVIFGIADYSADLGLPEIRNDHPSSDRARSAIVELSGPAGVAPIDSMTLDYPVRDPKLGPEENRRKVLASLKVCYEEARHGIALGMEGKWVGHPLQLVANELAYRSSIDPAAVAADVASARAYDEAVRSGRGAAVIAGLMADRATDRHVRRRLRRAFARGALPLEVARELGLLRV
jgi:citrate lyase subunit beta/citryl-CoA lyase